MADLYALTGDTAARLSRLLDAGPRVGGGVPSNGWSTAVVARCGGPDAANPGLYAASLVWHDSADWQAGAPGEVRLGDLDGLPLTPGELYLATGGGRTSTDQPVFWTHARPNADGGSGGSGGSGDDGGGGPTTPVPVTSLVDFCLDGTGGGQKRFRHTHPLTGAVLAEWCEDILPCGSGDLCDDLPPGGSGGSGGPGGSGDGSGGSGCVDGTVTWEWNGSLWVPVGGGCNDARQALYPPFPGTTVGQVTTTCCATIAAGE